MMERSVSASTTGSCSTACSTSGPPTPSLDASTSLDWPVTRLLLDEPEKRRPSLPIDIPSPKPHPRLHARHASDAASRSSSQLPSSTYGSRTSDAPHGVDSSPTQLASSSFGLLPGFSITSREAEQCIQVEAEVSEESTLERLERVVYLESSMSYASSSSPAIIVSISSVVSHSSPVHLPMQPPSSSAPGPARTRLRSSSLTFGQSSVVSILASALPTTTAATLGPAFGIVFGAVAGGSGNLFDTAGAKKAARNAYGAPDLQVYLARDFGSVKGSTNRKRMLEQRRKEQAQQKETVHKVPVQQAEKKEARKPELRRHTVTGQRSDHVRVPFELLPSAPRRPNVAALATPPSRAIRNRALRFAHTPPAPRVPTAQRLLLERLAEALGSNVGSTPSDIERTLDSASDSLASALSATAAAADQSSSGIVATSRTAEALRAASASASAKGSTISILPALGRAWEPNETLPRSPSLSPESSPAGAQAALSGAVATSASASRADAAHENPIRRAPPHLLRSAAWGDADDSDAAPPRRARKSKALAPAPALHSNAGGAYAQPKHSTPPPARLQFRQRDKEHLRSSSHAEAEVQFRKPKRLCAAARPVSTTALSLLDCWADFSGVWSSDAVAAASAEGGEDNKEE